MRSLQKRKSNFDIDNTANILAGIFFVAILLAVLLFVLVTIFGLSIFTTNTQINGTINTMQTNLVSMVANFFALMPVLGTILAVVILIAVIILLVLYVKRMKDSGTGTVGGFQG